MYFSEALPVASENYMRCLSSFAFHCPSAFCCCCCCCCCCCFVLFIYLFIFCSFTLSFFNIIPIFVSYCKILHLLSLSLSLSLSPNSLSVLAGFPLHHPKFLFLHTVSRDKETDYLIFFCLAKHNIAIVTAVVYDAVFTLTYRCCVIYNICLAKEVTNLSSEQGHHRLNSVT